VKHFIPRKGRKG